jgi:hypothetical protein
LWPDDLVAAVQQKAANGFLAASVVVGCVDEDAVVNDRVQDLLRLGVLDPGKVHSVWVRSTELD